MQFFHPIFTHPGKVILVQPCISLSPRFSFSKPISQISQISTMQEGKFHTESRELRRRRTAGRVGGPESVSSRESGPVQGFWFKCWDTMEQLMTIPS